MFGLLFFFLFYKFELVFGFDEMQSAIYSGYFPNNMHEFVFFLLLKEIQGSFLDEETLETTYYSRDSDS